MGENKSKAETVEKIPLVFKLRHKLHRGNRVINRIAWAPDGKIFATSSDDGSIQIWDSSTGELLHRLENHKAPVYGVAWSPDGQELASCSRDGTILLWHGKTGRLLQTLSRHSSWVSCMAWSPDGRVLASALEDGSIYCHYLFDTWRPYRKLKGHNSLIYSLAWSPDGQTLASGSRDKEIKLWTAKSWKLLSVLKGHLESVRCVVWSPDGQTIASASRDHTVRIWEVETGQQKSVLEKHTDIVACLSFSHDGNLLASKSYDGTIVLGFYKTSEIIAVLPEPSSTHWASGLAFHPSRLSLATLGNNDTIVRIWDLDDQLISEAQSKRQSIKYKTAKIVLVGDSGVGKTGLGWRLAYGEFKEHASTHGQQFWIIKALEDTRADGTECEAILWDLAGQPDYRLVHSLFLDDVDLALIVFDPTNREKLFGGVEYWLKQLRRSKNQIGCTILIGARVDRGTSTHTIQELEDYCNRQNLTGGYIATSAKLGEGISELLQQIKKQIPWDHMPATITSISFKRVKEYILASKENAGLQNVLINPALLCTQIQQTNVDWMLSDEEIMAAIKHLETHGYVSILKKSLGGESILLVPDLLINLASSFVLEARRNPNGFGVLEESLLLHGGYKFPELNILAHEEQETLLDAATVLFLEHNLCFRETFNDRTLLVFPSLINEKRPQFDDQTTIDDVSYRLYGAVENVYASLVVLLGYTNLFTRTHQWQNQAQYELGQAEICGFRQITDQAGEIELVLYYGISTPSDVRLLFQGMLERFLRRREVTTKRYPPVICSNPNCGERQQRQVVLQRIDRGYDFLYCNSCGEKLSFPPTDLVTALSLRDQEKVNQGQVNAGRRTTFESALVRIKSLLRERGKEITRPNCFISYARGIINHETWVLTLAKDLRNAGLEVFLDRWHNSPGTSIAKFIGKISSVDYAIAIGSPEYLKKYNTETSDPIVDAEIRLIETRLRKRTQERERVIPLLLVGEQQTSFPPLFEDSIYIDFRAKETYFVKLFDLILTLYRMPLDHAELDEIRELLTSESKGEI